MAEYENDLKKLKRLELVDVIDRLQEELEQAKQENAELKSRLEARTLDVANAGSLAEAALELNRVFEAAQAAADQYLENIKEQQAGAKERAEEELAQAREQAEKMRRMAGADAVQITSQAKREAEQILQKAREDASRMASDVLSMIENFVNTSRTRIGEDKGAQAAPEES